VEGGTHAAEHAALAAQATTQQPKSIILTSYNDPHMQNLYVELSSYFVPALVLQAVLDRGMREEHTCIPRASAHLLSARTSLGYQHTSRVVNRLIQLVATTTLPLSLAPPPPSLSLSLSLSLALFTLIVSQIHQL
jgi:hypothetical protein